MFGAKGNDACNMNALKGSTMSTVLPPERLLARVKVTEGLTALNLAYCAEFIRYKPVSLSTDIPKAFSNARQASAGSQKFGSVDSMKAYIGLESSTS